MARLTPAQRQRIVRFGLVGLSGVAVNLAAFRGASWALSGALRTDARYGVASALGIVVSIFTNFLLNDGWTWRDRRQAGAPGWFVRLGRFYLVASVGALVQWGVGHGARAVLASMTLPFGLDGERDTLSVLTGIAVGTVLNFVLNNFWTYRQADAP